MQEIIPEIIEKCQKGDKQAFDWLLKEYGPRLYRYFLRIAGDEQTAGDMLGDMFVKLLTKIKDYQDQGKFEHWLFRIAANLARDYGRKKTMFSLDNEKEGMACAGDFLPAKDSDPYQQLENNEQIDLLQKALAKLSQDQKEVILLRHYSQMSFEEISQQLDIPLGTALARAHRGLKKLKELMAPNYSKERG